MADPIANQRATERVKVGDRIRVELSGTGLEPWQGWDRHIATVRVERLFAQGMTPGALMMFQGEILEAAPDFHWARVGVTVNGRTDCILRIIDPEVFDPQPNASLCLIDRYTKRKQVSSVASL